MTDAAASSISADAGSAPDHQADEPAIQPNLVAQLLGTLGKAYRAHRIYEANNPVYQRFVRSVRDGFTQLWTHAASLELRVDEHAFDWNGTAFEVGEGRDSLAFLFYKDGIRYISFLPGFEEEVDRFLEATHRARQVEQYADDLISLLWEADFASFRHSYVDQVADAVEVPDAGPPLKGTVAPEQIAAEIRETALASGAPAPAAAGLSRDDFEETLYFLDEEELARVQAEIQREWQRDARTDVLNALFDRLEDSETERQTRILQVLQQLLPALLGRGDLKGAATVLVELEGLLQSDSALLPESRAQADRLLDELSEPEILTQLLSGMEQRSIEPDAEDLGVFLKHLRPQAMPILIRAIELTSDRRVGERLRAAMEGIAREHTDVVLQLLREDDPTLTAGAARLTGRIGLTEAAQPLVALLEHPAEHVRVAAVEALAQLRSATTVAALEKAIQDPSRDVRLVAIRGLGSLGYRPARLRLEQVLQQREMRDADLTEMIAFFEAYAAVAGAEGVPFLDRLLNGRTLIAGRQPTEVRACAARALGTIRTPAAQESLRKAAGEKDPLVRNAIAGALREGTP
ncbi:MAG: HEAT repeat domain-containing protein [Longimicrobiales bacterium]